MGVVISFKQRRDAARLQAIRDRLPEPGALRWIPRRKAAVVRAIDCGALTYEEARESYALSREELATWRDSLRDEQMDANGDVGGAQDRSTHSA